MVKIVYLKGLALAPKTGAKRDSVQKTGTSLKARFGKSKKKASSAHPKKPSPDDAHLGCKVVLAPGGRRHTLQTLDASSDTFGEDFGAAFNRSVKKARRENTRVIGQPDAAIAK